MSICQWYYITPITSWTCDIKQIFSLANKKEEEDIFNPLRMQDFLACPFKNHLYASPGCQRETLCCCTCLCLVVCVFVHFFVHLYASPGRQGENGREALGGGAAGGHRQTRWTWNFFGCSPFVQLSYSPEFHSWRVRGMEVRLWRTDYKEEALLYWVAIQGPTPLCWEETLDEKSQQQKEQCPSGWPTGPHRGHVKTGQLLERPGRRRTQVVERVLRSGWHGGTQYLKYVSSYENSLIEHF